MLQPTRINLESALFINLFIHLYLLWFSPFGLSLVLVKMKDKELVHMIICFVCICEFRLNFSYLNIYVSHSGGQRGPQAVIDLV